MITFVLINVPHLSWIVAKFENYVYVACVFFPCVYFAINISGFSFLLRFWSFDAQHHYDIFELKCASQNVTQTNPIV